VTGFLRLPAATARRGRGRRSAGTKIAAHLIGEAAASPPRPSSMVSTLRWRIFRANDRYFVLKYLDR
jgi:hypothetical protein